ncbi:MAG: carboxymuconolactone decarboxylase family protein [Gammaproteobacteria bacterium]|nr:carboxymuconolactone decarboxylase family protein [Gammaproteobacteria bacterium]
MSRLPELNAEELTAEQREVYDAIQSGPRGKMGLVGPFAVWVRAPTIGNAVQTLGGVVRFHTSLAEDVKEVAICTVGAHYHAKFEFGAHQRLASQAGVSDAVIDALREERTPEFDDDAQRISHAVAYQLLKAHRVDDATYGQAVEAFGEEGMIELVSVIGYYGLVSMTLNAFEVPLAANMDDPFPDHK